MPSLPFAVPVLRVAALLLTTILATACGSSTATPSPSGPAGSGAPPPSSSPSSTPGPTVGAIDHKTGATDVILRLEEGGGFVPVEFNISQAPRFTLYGNGVIVFQQLNAPVPQADANGIVRNAPWRTAKLDEDQIQEVLAFALGAGGLGAARESYTADNVADAPTSTFTIRAGGIDKTVAIYALFEEAQPGRDAVARGAFFRLAERLRDFDRGGTIDSDIYQGDRFRAVILPRDPAPELKLVDWPWPALNVTDFKPGANDGTDGPTFPHRAIAGGEVAALKLTGIDGGIQGPVLKAPNGTLYTLILRPLLVEETK
jgi:hypothetical protein